MQDLSSSQYAFKSNIVLQKYFYNQNDPYTKVTHIFKNKEKKVVAYRFENQIHSLEAFPLKFTKKPTYSEIHFILKKNSQILGFLNKNKPTEQLLTYIKIIIENKYYMYNYNINPEIYTYHILKGKKTELSEMPFSNKTYMFLDQYKMLNKKIKIKIMNKDRFKKIVTENTEAIFDVVTDLLDNYDDFIHNGLIAKIAKMPLSTVKNYTTIFKKQIDEHNISKYGTDNYTTFQLLCNIDDVKYAIANIKLNNQKPTIKKIANKTKLHRNTVSRIIKKHNIL